MDCLVCREPMVVLELDEVEIDHCLSCSGIWLDAGELELLLESSVDKDALLRSFEVDTTTTETPKKCPICLKKMQKVLCGRDKKILIDKCRDNHGLWFDRGELYEMIRLGGLDKDNKILAMLKDMFAITSEGN
ncbi:MAG: zf-TFIIB domain-containing protein [Candidatus Omnitrophota bacterium]